MVQATGRPEKQDEALVRSDEVLRLIDQEVVGALATRISRDVECGPYRRFALYLRIASTGTGTHVVQVIVEFLEPQSMKWHTYNQGLFASLYYEDTVTATEKDDVYEGLCAGRRMRVRLVGTNTSASLYFTISVAVEFFN